MAVGSDRVYVADGNARVTSLTKTDGGATPITTNASSPRWPVVDDVRLAWLEAPWEPTRSDAGAQLSFKDGDAGQVYDVQVGLATALTTYGGALYWLDVGTPTVQRLSETPGATPETVATLEAVELRAGRGLVIDPSRAFVGLDVNGTGLKLIEASLCGGPCP